LHADSIEKEKFRMRLLLRQGYKFNRDNVVLRGSFLYLFLRDQEGAVVMIMIAMHL
jgi:hypothetical protein